MRKFAVIGFVCGSGLIAGGGCGYTPSDAEAQEEGIVGGSVDGTHLGVVKLVSARGSYVCTGTVVKRDGRKQLAWIVTTATCAGAVSQVDLVTTVGATSRHNIIRAHLHSSPSEPGQDVAVLIASGAPANTATVALTTSDDEIAALRAITLVGFGASVRGDLSTDEVRRSVNKKVLSTGSRTFNWTQGPGTGAVCDGDMGGAVIRNSKLVGVIKAGAGCEGLGQQGAAERLKFTLGFINDKLDAAVAFTCGECRASEASLNPACDSTLSSTATACNDDFDCKTYTRCADVTCASVAPADRDHCVDQCAQGLRYDLAFVNYQTARCTTHCQSECASESLCLID